MYRLMVVDDEQIVLDAITHIINKSVTNVKVVATARSGREAIEKAKTTQPHIILIDIRMPGINGIEAIKEIKRTQRDIKYAIISAYEQFEFAKQAMELGVEYYILKPVNRTILINTVMKMITEIFEYESKKEKELETMEKLDKMIPYLEHGFIYSILLDREYNQEMMKYLEMLNVNHSGGYIMILQLGHEQGLNGLTTSINIGSNSISSGLGEGNYHYLRDVLKLKCNCIVGPVLVNKIIVYISSEFMKDEYEFRIQTIKLAEDTLELIHKKFGMTCFIGIGGYKINREIAYSYNEALRALMENQGIYISHILDICNNQSRDWDELQEVENIMGKILMGDEEGAANIFCKVSDRVRNNIEGNLDSKKNIFIEFMVTVQRKVMESGSYEDLNICSDDYIKEILSFDNIDKLILWCINRIKFIARKIQMGKSEKGNYIIKRAKEYINDKFKNDITLEELSKVLNISPQYFSRLFKEQTGYNFIEYLTFIRIEHSKELMNSTNMTIKEICYSVGYGDPNYFSRIFKKNTGISPTDYSCKARGKEVLL